MSEEFTHEMLRFAQNTIYRDPRVPTIKRVEVELADDINESLDEFMARLNAIVAKVPPGSREKARVTMENDYDSGRGPLWLRYEWLETPEEVQANVARVVAAYEQAVKSEALRAKQKEQHDREEYLRLKAKFGD